MSARRLGRLFVSDELLKEAPDFFEKSLPDVTVLRKERAMLVNSMEFLCECPEFDLVEEGGSIPVYMFTFDRIPDGSVARRPVEKEA